VYLFPQPAAETIAGFYPDAYMVYDENVRVKPRKPLELAVLRYRYHYSMLKPALPWRLLAPLVAWFAYRENIDYRPQGRLLDIGCGNGRFLQRMRAIGWNVQGVEFNAGAVGVCRRDGLEVFHGDIEAAAFADNSFDVITARHVIEHVPDPHSFMREIARLLKPGGRLLVRTPNSLALARPWFGTEWYANDVPRHLLLFSPHNLQQLARRHGLRPVQIRTLTSPKIILNSIDYKTANRGVPSKRRKLRRLLARLYVLLATLTRRGDEIYALFGKV
jgi:2-polyprenyl-3-methyl-5-hydroxy-6-metoxy-1,4-benzoquinol methylase